MGEEPTIESTIQSLNDCIIAMDEFNDAKQQNLQNMMDFIDSLTEVTKVDDTPAPVDGGLGRTFV